MITNWPRYTPPVLVRFWQEVHILTAFSYEYEDGSRHTFK